MGRTTAEQSGDAGSMLPNWAGSVMVNVPLLGMLVDCPNRMTWKV